MRFSAVAAAIHSRTTRLTLSYFSIIMALSVGFSIVFYATSSIELGKRIGPPTSAAANVTLPKGEAALSFNLHADRPLNGPAEAAYVRQQVEQGRHSLRRTLMLLDVAALLPSLGLSYFFARRTLKPIEAAIESRSRFASNASHELRTPLTVMQIQLENALATLALSKPARKVMESSLEEVTHLQQLSEDLLRLARHTEKPDLQPVWLDEVASLAMNRAVKSAQAKAMTITDASPHISVLADKQSLLQVIIILLDNAIKYGTSGSCVYIEGYAERKFAYLRVRDEGPGIRPDDLGHIFDRFYRAKPTHRQATAGHGLGLSIAQTLVLQQRGTITAISTLGEGSAFTIKLPLNR